MRFIIFTALYLSIVFACENGCSGHGNCEANDKCVCYPVGVVLTGLEYNILFI